METTQTVNLKTEALKNGAIWGVINLVIFLVVWYLMPDLMSTYWYAGITFIVGLSFAIFFCIDMRKKAGGHWPFKDALWHIFVMFLLSMAIMYVFNIVFAKFIDPSYPITMKENITAKTADMYKSIGMDEAAVEKGLEKQKEMLDKQFTPSLAQAISGFGIAAIFYFIGALIFAAIFKRNHPNPFGIVNEEQNTVQ